MCAFCLLPHEEKYFKGVFERHFEECYKCDFTNLNICMEGGKRHVELSLLDAS